MNQEEIDNLKRQITRCVKESVKKKKKTPYKQNSRSRWLHRQIIPRIHRMTYIYSSPTLPKDGIGGNTTKDIP